MCTVAFIPKGNKYYFVSLRDENPARPPALAPQMHSHTNEHYVSPTDGKSGGTWIGVSVSGSIIILLNGGIKDHERQQAYRKSRGLIVSSLLSCMRPIEQWGLMDMDNIEPFTLVVFYNNNLYELIWDGASKHCKKLPVSQPYLWSSSTLYSLAAKLYRKQKFDTWLAMNTEVSDAGVLDFFKSCDNKINGFIIDRDNKMRTLSFSFITMENNKVAVFQYFDLLNFSRSSITINFKINSKELVSESFL